MTKTLRQQFKSALCGILMGVLIPTLAFGQATLLPNAKQQYLDDAAQPVANGQVYYYTPNTSTLKTVWTDAAKTTASPNPVQLDAAGRPQPTGQTFGDGSYRQKVIDQNGLTVWDTTTASTGGDSSGAAVAWSEGVMVGTIIAWANNTLPAKYLYTAGQAIDRGTYSALLTAITYQTTILCQLSVATVTVSTAISDAVPIGAPIEASCFAPGATVISKSSGSLTISSAATISVSTSARIFPWGNGNGSSTFNVPDLRGRGLIGRNNMNGSNGTALSQLYYLNGSTQVNPNAIAAVGGNQSHTLLTSNMPAHNHSATVTDPGHTHIERGSATGGASNHILMPVNGTSGVVSDSVDSTASATTGVSVSIGNTGGGVAVSATVAAGGSGYTNGAQVATVSGGTCSTAPTFNVTVSGGAVTNPVLATPGLCSVTPSNPASVSVSGGGGSGATLTVSYSAAPVSVMQPSVTSDYIIKALPDDLPSGPGVTSLGGMTGSIACGVNLTCNANTVSVDLSGLSGLSFLAPSRLATAAVLPNSPTYSNGAAGVGATLTAGANSTLTVDGTLAALNDVILVKNQTSAFQNGIYTVTAAGSGAAPWVLTRATYFDTNTEMKAGSYTLITAGSTNANLSYVLQTAVGTVGTDPLTWVLFSSATSGVSSLDGAAGPLSVAPGSLKVVGTTLTSNVLSSRAFAATQNLSAYDAVQTLGYATPGDGGEATFVKTSARFRDTVVTSGSITAAGTGYTNGTYLGVAMTGSATAIVPTYANITVAGGVVTTVTLLDAYGRGAGSLVGDVLTTSAANIGGTGSGFTWTVGAVTTALASFTDTAGNRFQYVVSKGNHINPRQFGCKFDWMGVDASATNDGACLQAAINFASVTPYNIQSLGGAYSPYAVQLPGGSALICQTIILPLGVQLVGQGPFNSVIKLCDTGLSNTENVIVACDPNMHLACFGTRIANLGINSFNANGSSNTWAIYSNAAQQSRFIDNVAVYSGSRGCYKYETGYGGAATANIYDFFCTINTGAPNPGIEINTGTTVHRHTNIIVESGGSGLTGNGYNLVGGQITIVGYHSEGITNPVNVQMTVATHTATLMNATGGTGCLQFVTLQSTNVPGNFAMYDVVKNGCSTRLVTNGQPAGSNRSADALPKDGWVFFNP